MRATNNARIAQKARSRAEADFATWLMMAKLGSFDDLAANAQEFLKHYQERLKASNEKQASSATIDEIYGAYYTAMGGAGAPPAPKQPVPEGGGNVVSLRDAQRARASRAQPTGQGRRTKRQVPALLIFIALVVVVVAFKYLWP
jgi:hypothetical protein